MSATIHTLMPPADQMSELATNTMTISSHTPKNALPAAVKPTAAVDASDVRMSRVTTQAQSGFTLVEMIVVVVILSIFAGMISLSVGSSESRKNLAFYEHLTDSLSYVRLLSAERMQPMGMSLQADKQGQITPVIVTLSNPYIRYQTPAPSQDGTPKSAMELSADLSGLGSSEAAAPTPSWDIESEVTLPALPPEVQISIQSLEASGSSTVSGAMASPDRELQPWFTGQAVPQVLWFGTGQAAPVTIEVRHQSRLVGEVITIMPDGSMVLGTKAN